MGVFHHAEREPLQVVLTIFRTQTSVGWSWNNLNKTKKVQALLVDLEYYHQVSEMVELFCTESLGKSIGNNVVGVELNNLNLPNL